MSSLSKDCSLGLVKKYLCQIQEKPAQLQQQTLGVHPWQGWGLPVSNCSSQVSLSKWSNTKQYCGSDEVLLKYMPVKIGYHLHAQLG